MADKEKSGWAKLTGLQKGLVIGLPILLVAIIVVIIIVVTSKDGNGGVNNGGLNNGGGGGGGGCNTTVDCTSGAVIAEAERFYNEDGEWAGSYTADVTDISQVNNNTCDYGYDWTAVGGTAPQGTDYRRFTYTQDPSSCAWGVGSMGGHLSGEMAFPSYTPENPSTVTSTDYSVTTKTREECLYACNTDPNCIGYQFPTATPDGDAAACWVEYNLTDGAGAYWPTWTLYRQN